MIKKNYDITKDYRACGNMAIDGVASCIMYHRKLKIGLRAIYLKPFWYELFKKGTINILGRPLEEGEFLSMDGINIEKGSLFQSKPILPETFNDFTKNMGYAVN